MIAFAFFKFILSSRTIDLSPNLYLKMLYLYTILPSSATMHFHTNIYISLNILLFFLNQYKDWLNLTFLVHLSEYEISNRVFRTELVCFKRNRLHVSSIVLSLGVNRLLGNSSKIIINVLTYWLVCAVLLSKIVFQVIKNVLFCC